MRLLTRTISKNLHPAYRVQNVERGSLERFKTELARLFEHLGHSAQESEEHLKNIVSDFLKAAFYREEHFVNTKDRQDMEIGGGRCFGVRVVWVDGGGDSPCGGQVSVF